MAHQLFKNNAHSTLNGTLAIGGTTINLATGHGSRFPSVSAGEYFYITLYELNGTGDEITYEVVKVTGRTADTLTVERDAEGLVVEAGGTAGGWAYPSAPGINPSGVVYVALRYTAYAAGNNLTKDDNLASLVSASTARTNLGLGSMATQNSNNVAITGGTISGVTLTDNGLLLADDLDNTKKAQFQLGGITTATTRTMTVPNTDVTLAGTNVDNNFSANQTFQGTLNKVTITAPASAAVLTLANNSTLATSGAYSTTLTATAATNVTLPTTGTLATLAGSETLTNKTLTSPTLTTPTLTLKAGTTPTAEGDIQWDSTNDRIVVGNGATTTTFVPSEDVSGDITMTTAGVTAIGTAKVTSAMLRNSGALSVVGRSANSAGVPADVSATAASGAVLRESGSTIGFGTIATAGITDAAVTYAKIQNVSATDKILGRSTAGAGVVEEITCTAAGRALLDDVDAAAQRTTLGLAIGTNVQAYDADLTTWAGVTPGTGVTTMLATPTKANFDAALSDDNFAYVGTANTFTATQQVTRIGVGQAQSATSTAVAGFNGDIALSGANRMISGNVHFDTSWKYLANGYGWGFRENNAGVLQFLTAANNTGGAGAAASPSYPISLNLGTGATTFTAANAVRVEAASTQDAVVLAGRAGGTGSYAVTLTPTTLASNVTMTLPATSTTVPIAAQQLTFSGPTAARTITLPDANFTAARTDAAQSFTGLQTFSTGITSTAASNSFGATSFSGNITSSGNPSLNLGSGALTAGSGTFSGRVSSIPGGFVTSNSIAARYNASNPEMGIGIAGSNGFPYLGYNVNPAVGNDNGTYDLSQAATRLRLDNGQFKFQYAASGTPGAAISWSDLGTLSSTGLSVTGSVDATTTVRANGRAMIGDNGLGPVALLWHYGLGGASNAYVGVDSSGGAYVNAKTGMPVEQRINGSTITSVTSAGLSVTGSVSAETGNTAANAIQARYNSSNPPVSLAATTSNAFPYVGFNTVQKVSSDGQTYATNNYASRIKASNGGVSFDIAGSGTAGADISWTQAMTLNASGNLGLGVTPSAWSAYAAQQNQRLGLYGSTGNGGVSFNSYYDGAAWRYIGTDYATNYDQYIGQHRWFTAPSGTAGNAITFGAAKMTLDASGNLSVAGAVAQQIGYVEINNSATGSLVTGLTPGIYMVFARQNGAANGGIRAMGMLTQGSSTNTFDSLIAAGGATLSADGSTGVNLTNTAGGLLGVRWSVQKVCIHE